MRLIYRQTDRARETGRDRDRDMNRESVLIISCVSKYIGKYKLTWLLHQFIENNYGFSLNFKIIG